MRTSSIPLAALALALGLAAPPTASAENEAAAWYVLRDRMSGDCWTGVLIRINGQLASGKHQIAGGPFDSKEAAEAHIADLVARGTCAEA